MDGEVTRTEALSTTPLDSSQLGGADMAPRATARYGNAKDETSLPSRLLVLRFARIGLRHTSVVLGRPYYNADRISEQ